MGQYVERLHSEKARDMMGKGQSAETDEPGDCTKSRGCPGPTDIPWSEAELQEEGTGEVFIHQVNRFIQHTVSPWKSLPQPQ